jgi:UDP-N-acetylglucosamine 3-dehydrogenase
MGRHHVRVYSELENCELVGVSDPNPEKEELATQFGAQFFADHRALLEQRPDLVTIAAPTSHHYALACEALEAGCHLLVEKPITDNLEAAADLIARANAAGKTIAVGHIERFNPAVSELKQMIDSGELGEVLTVNALRVGPYHGRILDTGIVLDLGTHDVDLASYLLDSRARTVYATAIQRLHNHEDHAVLHLSFPESKVGVIETSWLAPYRARNVFIVGTKHFALCDLVNQLILVYEDNPEGGNLLAGLRSVPRGEPLKRELESVVASILNGSQPVSTAEDSAYALRVCLAALSSIETGQSVTVTS